MPSFASFSRSEWGRRRSPLRSPARCPPLWGALDAAAGRLSWMVGAVAASYGLVMAVGLAWLAPHLLAWIVPRYVDAGPALRILGWSLVFRSVSMVMTAALNSLGQHRSLAYIAAATLGFAVIANGALIPWLGIRGASLATVLTEVWNCGLQTAPLFRLIQRRFTASVI